MKTVEITFEQSTTSKTVSCIKTESYLDRMLGLMRVKQLADQQVLWINPCNSVHTFGMKAALDLIYLDKTNTVKKLVEGIKPARGSLCWRAHSVLEANGGFISQLSINEGDKVKCSE